MTDTDILFLWLVIAAALCTFASVVQAYHTPEARAVREARAYDRAVHLASEQPARRRRRLQHVTQ